MKITCAILAAVAASLAILVPSTEGRPVLELGDIGNTVSELDHYLSEFDDNTARPVRADGQFYTGDQKIRYFTVKDANDNIRISVDSSDAPRN